MYIVMLLSIVFDDLYTVPVFAPVVFPPLWQADDAGAGHLGHLEPDRTHAVDGAASVPRPPTRRQHALLPPAAAHLQPGNIRPRPRLRPLTPPPPPPSLTAHASGAATTRATLASPTLPGRRRVWGWWGRVTPQLHRNDPTSNWGVPPRRLLSLGASAPRLPARSVSVSRGGRHTRSRLIRALIIFADSVRLLTRCNVCRLDAMLCTAPAAERSSSCMMGWWLRRLSSHLLAAVVPTAVLLTVIERPQCCGGRT